MASYGLALAIGVMGTACGSKPALTESTVELGGAAEVAVSIDADAGDLVVTDVPGDAAVVSSETNVASWVPVVAFETSDGFGVLDVRSTVDGRRPGGEASLTLGLTRGPRHRITVTRSSGNTLLDLGALDVFEVTLAAGPGETELILSPAITDLVADVTLGNLVVWLPVPVEHARLVLSADIGFVVLAVSPDIGVRVRTSGRGSIVAPGFVTEDDAYVNAAYTPTGPGYDIVVDPGAGGLEIRNT